ncbi:MAG: hypothetical protein A2W91_09310 [Bacteroidetes bacterium GWF2_38_335]|nr:MAG: hypothetical protein A2W91_09310 [Bacteroidetes bacterium GWF2_38_335]OFY80833.1 MAG: hypothetical protein A2281_09190 [Bacteroidetes bacterium RIFOXYA12_FULL_38_20]
MKSQNEVIIGEVTPSLLTDDHTAEGFLVTLSSGRIIHFFRLEEGIFSNHIGNGGKIVKRYSDDNGATWSENILVYDDEYDDRNVHGGRLESDRIVLFFRRFDANFATHVDMNFIYSDDGGETWSTREVINTEGISCGTHTLNYVPGKGYMNIFMQRFYIELRFSEDGSNWDSIAHIWDYRENQEFPIGEVSLAYVGDGKIIGLIRDISEEPKNFMQFVSEDYGETWTDPRLTNIADTFYCVSPLNFFDPEKNELFSIATDRRGAYYFELSNFDSKVWIYKNKPDEIFNQPLNYNLVGKIDRPVINSYRFYGYPTATKMANGKYLVIFTESFRRPNFNENADFYQFIIEWDETTTVEQKEISNSKSWPVPFSDLLNLEFNLPGIKSGQDINLIITDIYGKTVYSNKYKNSDFNSITISTEAFEPGIYFYSITAPGVNLNEKIICIR